jgi:hypothetical protein
VQATHRLRALWRQVARLSLVAVVAAFVAAAITIAGHTPDKPVAQLEAYLLGSTGAVMAGGVLLSMHARRRTRNEDGVRLAGWFGPHRLSWTSNLPEGPP